MNLWLSGRRRIDGLNWGAEHRGVMNPHFVDRGGQFVAMSSSLQVLINEQEDTKSVDPIFTLQLIQPDPLINDDEDELNSTHHSVQRSLSQLNELHHQYATINTTCILPVFPTNTSNVRNRLDRYYRKLFVWAPEIENWAGLHEFFSDRTPLIKGATKSPGIIRHMIESLMHKRSTHAPALPAHYSSKERVELKHDTLAVYKKIIQHECDMRQLQSALTNELVTLCQQGKLAEELGDKLEDLATIKVCTTGNFGSSKDKSIALLGDDVHTRHEEIFSEEVALRSHSAFEMFCNRTVQALGQIELAEQAFIKHVSEQVIEPVRDHLHDFNNAKVRKELFIILCL